MGDEFADIGTASSGPSQLQTFLGGLAGGLAQGINKRRAEESALAKQEAMNQVRMELGLSKMYDPLLEAKKRRMLAQAGLYENQAGEYERVDAGSVNPAYADKDLNVARKDLPKYQAKPQGGRGGSGSDPAVQEEKAQRDAIVKARQAAESLIKSRGLSSFESVKNDAELARQVEEVYQNTYKGIRGDKARPLAPLFSVSEKTEPRLWGLLPDKTVQKVSLGAGGGEQGVAPPPPAAKTMDEGMARAILSDYKANPAGIKTDKEFAKAVADARAQYPNLGW
jgi:hypothetical protein